MATTKGKTFTHLEKRNRNKRLYEFWLAHSEWSQDAIANVFHISQMRVSQILRAEANKRALGGDGQKQEG